MPQFIQEIPVSVSLSAVLFEDELLGPKHAGRLQRRAEGWGEGGSPRRVHDAAGSDGARESSGGVVGGVSLC